MAKIKKIKLSGETYDICDPDALHTVSETGSGNAVTAVSASGSVITATKGETFATASALTAEASTRANVDALLSDRVSSLEQRGRYLSGWNCSTGKPTTYPTIAVGETYTYKSGDYYIVTVGGTAGDKMPKGAGITRTGESAYTVPTDSIPTGVEVTAGDTYTYDGTSFVLSHSADNNQTVKGNGTAFSPNDVVDFIPGSNVQIVGNATNKSITISASDTHYTNTLTIQGSGTNAIVFDQQTNKSVNIVGGGSTTVVGAANKITITSTDHVTSIASTTGTGNVITGITASNGNLTLIKGITAAASADVSSMLLDYVKTDGTRQMTGDLNMNVYKITNLADPTDSSHAANKKYVDTIASSKLENVAIGSIQGTVSACVASFEAQAAGELALLNKADIKTSSAASHTHSLSGTISGSGTISVPTVQKTANKLVTTSIVPTNGTVSITPAVANGSATLTVFGTDTIASKASFYRLHTYTGDAIRSAVIDIKASATTGYQAVVTAVGDTTLTGTKTFNTDAIKDITLSTTTSLADGPAVVTAVGATTLTGTKTFNTDAIKSATCSQSFTTEAYKAEYNSANECLELTSVTPTAVSISTSAATTASVGISSGTVTTKYMKHTNTAAGTGTVGISSGAVTTNYIGVITAKASTGSFAEYNFEDVTVPVVTSNAQVAVATVGTAVSAAKVGSAVTVATGSLSSTGSGSDVTSTISIGTSEQSVSISTTLSGSTGSAGSHDHTIIDA